MPERPKEFGGEHPKENRGDPPVKVHLSAGLVKRLRAYARSRNQTVDSAMEDLLRSALDQLPGVGGQGKFAGGNRLVRQRSSKLNVTSLSLHEGPAARNGLH